MATSELTQTEDEWLIEMRGLVMNLKAAVESRHTGGSATAMDVDIAVENVMALARTRAALPPR